MCYIFKKILIFHKNLLSFLSHLYLCKRTNAVVTTKNTKIFYLSASVHSITTPRTLPFSTFLANIW